MVFHIYVYILFPTVKFLINLNKISLKAFLFVISFFFNKNKTLSEVKNMLALLQFVSIPVV